jgi:hypothetical protein
VKQKLLCPSLSTLTELYRLENSVLSLQPMVLSKCGVTRPRAHAHTHTHTRIHTHTHTHTHTNARPYTYKPSLFLDISCPNRKLSARYGHAMTCVFIFLAIKISVHVLMQDMRMMPMCSKVFMLGKKLCGSQYSRDYSLDHHVAVFQRVELGCLSVLGTREKLWVYSSGNWNT